MSDLPEVPARRLVISACAGPPLLGPELAARPSHSPPRPGGGCDPKARRLPEGLPAVMRKGAGGWGPPGGLEVTQPPPLPSRVT